MPDSFFWVVFKKNKQQSFSGGSVDEETNFEFIVGLAAAGAAFADAAPAGVVSDPLALDIESGVRSEEIIGALSYDTLWQGVTNVDYRILVNGAVLATGSGTGTVAWHPTRCGIDV